MAKKKKKIDTFEKTEPYYSPYVPPVKKTDRCDLCGEIVTVENTKYNCKTYNVYCDEQLRLCILKDIPSTVAGFLLDIYTIDETNTVQGVDIDLNREVVGRKANKEEIKYFKKHKTLNGLVPWCMVRTPHYRTCKKIPHKNT